MTLPDSEVISLIHRWQRIAERHFNNPVCATEFQLGEETAYEDAYQELQSIIDMVGQEPCAECGRAFPKHYGHCSMMRSKI